jgi:hypothetical protein
MTERAAGCLALGLSALEDRTDAPLRVLGHSSSRGHEVFEVEEAFELGADGRRYLVSVAAEGSDALLIAMPRGGRD